MAGSVTGQVLNNPDPAHSANKREKSGIFAAIAVLCIAAGLFFTVTKGFSFIDYGLSWQVRYMVFAVPAVIFLLISGYLRLTDLKGLASLFKDLMSVFPRIRLESRNDEKRVGHDKIDR